jgi:hypothetical protein
MAHGKQDATSAAGDDCDCPGIGDKDEPIAPKTGTPSAAYSFAIDRFVPKAEERDNILLPLADYRAFVTELGWERLFLADAITGRPGEFFQLWRIPGPDGRAQVAGVEKSARYRDFRSKLETLENVVTTPMPYDPNHGGQRLTSRERKTPGMLLIDTITLKKGALARFTCTKQGFFIPTVSAAPYDWRLVGAGATDDAEGTIEVVQIWELPEANRLAFTMQRIGQDATFRSCLLPCIDDENQQLLEAIDWA